METRIQLNAARGVENGDSAVQVISCYQSIAETADLVTAAERLIASVKTLVPCLAGSVFFLYDAERRRLAPLTARQPDDGQPTFQISKTLLNQALTEKTTVWRTLEQTMPRDSGFICDMPMVRGGRVIGVVHAELWNADQAKVTEQIGAVGLLLEMTAPLFELLLASAEASKVIVGMAQTINASIEAKDTYTSGHSERVGRFTAALGVELKLSEDDQRLLFVSALCHDVGKMGVADAILKKPSILSTDEFEEMKAHPVIGAEIISRFPSADRIIGGVKHHHERWDGTGYPDHLEGENIPLFARIIAVADAFDAMTSGRSYSGYMNEQTAIEQLSEARDLFDSEVLAALGRAWQSGRLSIRTGTTTGEK